MEPSKTVRETYRITIEKVTKTETEQTTTKYYDQNTAKEITWSEWYNDGDHKPHHVQHEVPNGKMTVDERKEQIYQQEKDNLDVADLALYINRGR